MTVEECFEEWANDTTENAAEKEAAGEKSPMASKHLCTSCYLKGKEDYMLPAKAFGMKQRQDYYPMYVSQGAWTRCLQCDPQSLRAQRMETEPSRTAQETEPSRTAQETEPTRTAHAEKTSTTATMTSGNMVCATCYSKVYIRSGSHNNSNAHSSCGSSRGSRRSSKSSSGSRSPYNRQAVYVLFWH